MNFAESMSLIIISKLILRIIVGLNRDYYDFDDSSRIKPWIDASL